MPRRKKGVKIEGAARPGNSTASKVVPNHRYDLRRRLPPFYGKDDLDILLQNNRKGRKKARDSQSGIPSLTAAQTSAKITAELYKPLDSASSDATSEEPTSTVLQQLDPQEAYYREVGYLPPWDQEVLDLVQAALADPDMADRLLTANTERA